MHCRPQSCFSKQIPMRRLTEHHNSVEMISVPSFTLASDAQWHRLFVARGTRLGSALC
jgi:hypothetical protein